MSDVEDGARRTEAERPLPANWILQHPKFQDMMELEVGDDAQVYAAFLVYLDLTEVRQWKDVTCRASLELRLVLLEGREREAEPIQVVVPMPANRVLSHRWLRSALSQAPPDSPPAPTLLCAVASDSSLVYQRLCMGMLVPEPPASIQDQGSRQYRKRKLH